jgi:choline dehydrogenase
MNQSEKNKPIFDYVVVGTGPAGAVIAKKLTDDNRTSVLILEAGDNNSNEIPIRDSLYAPPFILRNNFSSQYYWPGKGIPQKYVNSRSFPWTGGRTLGGTSSVNNEQYVRPSQANMKQWEDFLGPLWSPKQETDQFSKLENYNGMTNNSNARGFNGRLDIRQTPVHPTSMVEKLVLAMERATGFPRILDYNDPCTPIGPFTRWQLYQMPNSIRESSDTAFLSPDIVNRYGQGVGGRRLIVSLNSTAQRIIFNNKKCAIGVEFVKEGKCICAYARKKVIISAGIRSPQLLMLSGIGPSKTLNEAGVPVICHNPNVGRHLTTHAVNMVTFTTNPHDKALPDNDPFALYSSGAFLPDPTPGADQSRRGVQVIGLTGKDNTLNIAFYLTEPKARGSLKIQNNDPLKMVLANEGFLNHPDDIAAIKNVLKVYIKNIAAELSRIDSNYRLISPTLETIDDDQKLEAFIKENLDATHHVQGTLRMAPNADSGVVDASGHVFGVKNLIVADDSIAPFVSDGNTSAPSFFIGANIAYQLLKSSQDIN